MEDNASNEHSQHKVAPLFPDL